MSRGYDPSWKWTDYHHAIANGSLMEDIDLFDQDTAVGSIDQPDVQGITPLHLACLSGNVEYVNILLERGAVTNTMDCKYWSTPLITAVRHNYIEIVRLLLDKGFRNIDHVDIFGLKARDYASEEMLSCVDL